MKGIRLYLCCMLIPFLFLAFQENQPNPDYKWLDSYKPSSVIINRILPPAGYKRAVYAKESIGYWFEHLELSPAGTKVKLYNGDEKRMQDVHEAVINIDCGKKDLQQCAVADRRLLE